MNTPLTRRRLKDSTLVLAGWLLTMAGLSAAQAPASTNNGEVRFAVAHKHMASWCYGYLYVNAGQVRYEVVQPQSDRGHSFSADRSSVTAAPWVLFGQPTKDFFNIKTKGQNFRFLWLANEAEVNSGGAHRMSPPESAPPDTLIAAIQNQAPAAPAMQQGAVTQAAAVGANAAVASQQPLSNPTSAAAGASMSNPQSPQAPDQMPVPQGDVRFAVAHYHQDGSWCYGYLYVTHDQVRYEVVQPEAYRAHAFAINRSSTTARTWVAHPDSPGQPDQSTQDAFELSSQGTVYHFRWLANETDVNSGNAHPAQPPLAAPPDLLIKSIQPPTTRMRWIMPGPARVATSTFDLAMNQSKRARPAVWR